MPMGIVSDNDFSSELVRTSLNGLRKDALPNSPTAVPDGMFTPDNEPLDVEPKEIGLQIIGSEARFSESEIRSAEARFSDLPDKAQDLTDDARPSIHTIEKGRPIGRNNRTDEERKIIAGEALISGTGITAKKFGIADSTVSAYKHGATSTSSYNQPDDELLRSVSRQRVQIAHVAHGKLSQALDNITSEKLSGANLRTLASVAQSMSAIVKNMEPDNPTANQQNIQFTFYAPKQRDENKFDVIDMQNE